MIVKVKESVLADGRKLAQMFCIRYLTIIIAITSRKLLSKVVVMKTIWFQITANVDIFKKYDALLRYTKIFRRIFKISKKVLEVANAFWYIKVYIF